MAEEAALLEVTATGPLVKLGFEVAKWMNGNVKAVLVCASDAIVCASKVNENTGHLIAEVEKALGEKEKFI